ncbi:MAG: hypothetical protein QG556_724 [Pseudomonadota bacterium]|nr:hypothetical protein [Pseudomonadota bacterium]
MKITEWVVVTGPPSSGKTTLIEALQAKGYLISPEVARELIVECTQTNTFQSIDIFQRQLLAITCRREHFLDSNQMIFFDRGIPDSIAYFKYNHLDTKDAMQASKFRRYKQVFYCEGLPVIHDAVRKESDAAAKKIGRLILEAYQILNYHPIILPVVSVEQRLNLILNNIGVS